MENVAAPDLIGQFKQTLVKDRVGIVEFAESDQYCNVQLYPRQKTLLKMLFLEELNGYDEDVLSEWVADEGEVTIAPRIRERIDFLKENKYPHFRIIQMVGGRRASKGLVTALALAYKLYSVTQIESPHRHFNIQRGKPIEFAIVAASLEQAKAHQFDDAYNTLIECKPLQDQKLISRAIAESITVYTPYDLRRVQNLRSMGSKIDKDSASLRVKAHGTNSKTIRGSATLFFVFDEMAHLIEGESRMSDEQLFTAVQPSLRQFGKNSMTFTNSSPYQKTGKFFKIFEQCMQDGSEFDKPLLHDYFMLQFPSWELYKDWEKDAVMSVLIGETGEPPALSPEESPLMAQDELTDPEKFKVEHRAQFAEVIDAFLRPEMVDRMYDPAFAQEQLGRVVMPTEGAIAFTRYKGHGDPSSTTANFGIAIAHVEEVTNPQGIKEPHVVFDLINAFFPEDFKEHTIDWLEVAPTVADLINKYRPFEFTFDQFDSTMAIQVLQREVLKVGAETQLYQKKATHKSNEMRALNFKAALNLGRVHAAHPSMYNPNAERNPIELSRQELKFLQVKNGKVDKQTIGPVQTKDIADCIMECVDALIGDSLAVNNDPMSVQMEMGAQHGYNIGKYRTSEGTPFEDFYRRGEATSPFMPERGMRRRPGH